MDWTNRGDRSHQPQHPTDHQTGTANNSTHRFKRRRSIALPVASLTLILAIAILVVLLLFVIMRSPNIRHEDKFVNTKAMQAVFLNNGQVYFGHINDLNSQYLRLSNIYYLRVNQQVQPKQPTDQSSGNFSLAKLGCDEIHKPSDEMIINRDQITFWENLQTDGEVAKAITANEKAYPDGLHCPPPSKSPTNSSNTPAPTNKTPASTTPSNHNLLP